MMSLEAMLQMPDRITARAQRERLTPYVPYDLSESERWPPFPFPSIGHYVPGGWEPTDYQWLVDKTGVAEDWEPALTAAQLKAALRTHVVEYPGTGFAITKEGEFQVVISAFHRIDEKGELS